MNNTEPSQGLSGLLPQIVDIARRAGSILMQLHGRRTTIVETDANSLQTEADRLSHAILIKGLEAMPQGWPILSEEGPESPLAEREGWRYFWLVDPLDGTREFLRKSDEFTVNIALIEGDAPILGVVFAPAKGVLYYAAKGMGAWKSNGNGVSQISVGKSRGEAIRVLVSRSHCSTERTLPCISDRNQLCEFIAMGSSLKFCLVAEGAADIYPRTGRTMEWDTAAAQCILEEAGGSVIDGDGYPIRYNKPQLANHGFLALGMADPLI